MHTPPRASQDRDGVTEMSVEFVENGFQRRRRQHSGQLEMLFGKVLAAAIAAHEPVQAQTGLRLDRHIGSRQPLAIGPVDEGAVEFEIKRAAVFPAAGADGLVHALGYPMEAAGHGFLSAYGEDAADRGGFDGGANQKYVGEIAFREIDDEDAAMRLAAQKALLDQALHRFPERAAAYTEGKRQFLLVELDIRRQSAGENVFP